MAEGKEKAVLVTFENIRVKEYDSQNVVLEGNEENLNPFTKELVRSWKFKGYFPTVFKALTFVVKKDLLIDRKAISDLKSYLKQVEDSNKQILEVINKWINV